MPQLAITADEERGTGEERNRQRSLRDDERAARPSAQSSGDDSASPGVQGRECLDA
jgi:hypothetical protein